MKDVEKLSVHTNENGEHIVQYQIVDALVRTFSGVVIECFLTGAIDEKIDGQPISIFMNELMGDLGKQAFMTTTFIFGARHLNWGLTAFDRDVNRRLALFKKWGLTYIEKKIEQAKNKLKT